VIFQPPEQDWKEKTGEDLCAEMNKLMEENEFVIQKYHKQWFYQIAMRIGAQWLQNNPEGFTILPENTEGHVRMVVNKLLAGHQLKLAKIIKNNPWFEIEADKTSYKSKVKARKGTKLSDYIYAEQKGKKKIKTVATWAIDTGTAFLFVYWDWDKGDLLTDYQPVPDGGLTEEMTAQGLVGDEEGFLIDQTGERLVAAQTMSGDVVYEFVSPFDVYPYGIKADGTALGLIYKSEHDVEEMKKKYPDFADKIVSNKDKKSHIDYYKRIMGIVSYDSYYASESKNKGNTCMVEQLFEEPSVSYPKGRHIIRIGDIVVHRGDLPYAHGRIPLIKFTDIENSGQYWGMGTMQNGIPIQVGYNKSMSQLIENADNHANLKFKATREAEIAEETLDNTCTEVILYNRGETVDKLDPGSLPNYFMSLIQNIYPQTFNDVLGQHEVTQGEAEPGVKSGRAIEALQSQDETRNIPMSVDFNCALEELGEQVMALYEEHVPEDREFSIRGTGKKVKIGPEDLKDMWKNVTVRATSMMSRDMYMKKEELKELWGQGLFGPPQDPKVRKKVMQLYEFGNIESMFEDEDLDTEWAQEENDLLIGDDTSQFIQVPDGQQQSQMIGPNGLPLPQRMIKTLPVKEWEDQIIHIQEHNNLRKSREFRELPPDIQERVNAHIKEHEALQQALAPVPPQPDQLPVKGEKAVQVAA